jgi:small subunit ribosomal protein S13
VARIAGVDIPRDKRIEVGLIYIYGIGISRSRQILRETGINPDTRVKDLTESEVSAIREYISKGVVSVHDAGVGFDTVSLYKKLEAG